jgi:hypothetical protein
MSINAQSGPQEQSPTYTFTSTGARLPWVQFLRAWADEVARQQPDDTAHAWLAEQISHLASQATMWGVATPAEHTTKQQQADLDEAAYVAHLENECNHISCLEYDCNAPDIFGSLIGPDEHAMRAWIAPPDDLIN